MAINKNNSGTSISSVDNLYGVSARLITIPTPNPIPNSASIAYSYNVNPSLPNVSGFANTNIVDTQINIANIDMIKSASSPYANIGDILTYTIVLRTTGNTSSVNIVFFDTVPNNTTFLPNSFTQNGATKLGANPQVGVTIPNMSPNNVTTLTFQVRVDSIPTPNPMSNSADAAYQFVIDPSIPIVESTRATSNSITTQINNASLTIDKIVNKYYADVDDILLYTLVVKSIGNVTANNVTIIDTIPNGVKFVPDSVTINGVSSEFSDPAAGIDLGDLYVGALTTTTFNVAVTTIPTLNPIPIDNQGVAKYVYMISPTSTLNNSVITNVVTTTVNSANLEVTKLRNRAYVATEDIITYRIVVTNTGSTTATTIKFSDTIPNGTNFNANSFTINGITQLNANPQNGVTIPNISPGSTTTVTFSVTVVTVPNPNPIANVGVLSYKYTTDPTNPNSQSRTSTSNIATSQFNQANIDPNNNGIVKSVSKTTAKIGDMLTYTIAVKNSGNVSANNINFSDTLPIGVALVPNTVTVNGELKSGANPQAGFNMGNIEQGATSTVQFQVTVTTIPAINPMQNQAIVNYTYTTDPSAPNGRSAGAASNIVDTRVSQAIISNADGGLIKTSNKAYAKIGDTLTYTIKLKNTGNVPANNVILSDTIPNGTIFMLNSVTLNGVIQEEANPQSGINVGTLDSGASATVTFMVTIDSIPIPNPISNTAIVAYTYTVDPSNPNGEVAKNISNENKVSVNYADISQNGGGLFKSTDKVYADINDVITYTIDLKNTGNVTANNVTFIDTIPIGTSLLSNSVTVNGSVISGANPQSGIDLGQLVPNVPSTISFKVVVTTIPAINLIPNNGTITYKYTVNPTAPNSQFTSNITNTVTTQINTANITSTKKTIDKQYAKIGDIVTYAISFTNSGSATAINVTIVDTLPAAIEFIPGSVIINGSIDPDESPVSGITVGSVIPGENVLVTFRAKVVSIPTPNPIINTAKINYGYKLYPNGETIYKNVNVSGGSINVRYANISTSDGGLIKSVDTNFAQLNDVLTYTIVLKNTGNVTANNLRFIDTIPSGTLFNIGSVVVNGVSLPYENPQQGINLFPLGSGLADTITFRVSVVTIPSHGAIINVSNVVYDFTVDPSAPNVVQSNLSNEASTTINYVDFSGKNFTKDISENFAAINDIVVYSFNITNEGNTSALDVVFKDTIPNGTSLVPNSVIVGGIVQSGANPQTGINLNTIVPMGLVSLSFAVLVNTIPSPNPISNNGVLNYSLIVEPDFPPSTGSALSNTEELMVNSPNIVIIKTSDKTNAVVGDIVEYTVKIQNHGNIAANDIVVTDTLPSSVLLEPNSLSLNDMPIPDSILARGIPVGIIAPGDSATIKYKVDIIDRPPNGSASNQAITDYTYVIDPTKPQKQGASASNINTITISIAQISLTKTVNKNLAILGDILTYNVVVQNTGTIDATNIIFYDSLPDVVSFVPNSFTLNGGRINGANVTTGINIGTLKPKEKSVIQYKVKVNKICCTGIVTNEAYVTFSYKATPNGDVGSKYSDVASVSIPGASPTFKQLSVDRVLMLPKIKPDIEDVNDVTASIDIESYRVVKSIIGVSNENKSSTGYKLIINAVLKQFVEYTADIKEQNVYSSYYESRFTTFIVLPDDYQEGSHIQISPIIEDVYFNQLNNREVFTNVTIYMGAKTLC